MRSKQSSQSTQALPQKKQQGIALITALIIMTIALSLAANIIYRQQIQIRLSSNIAHLEQAYVYANGMEDWAGTLLKRSFDDHPKYDSLEDNWATGGQLISLPIDGGVMNGQLQDLQARINLNSLARPVPRPLTKAEIKANKKPRTDFASITRYRLLELIRQVDPDNSMGLPQNFAQIAKDWIDKDQTNGNKTPDDGGTGSGAESPHYQSLENPYFSADTLMVSPTEMRLLKDMDKKIYKKLLPFIATLPITSSTPININTASKEIIQSIGFDPDDAEKIIKERKVDPFKSMSNSFLKGIISQQGNNIDKNDIDVKTHYFLLTGSVNIGRAKVFISSILKRGNNGLVSVIMRDFSNP